MTHAPWDIFLGTWIFDPQQTAYEHGQPPLEGRYTISYRDGQLLFEIAWRDAQNQEHATSFQGIPDGKPHPFPNPAIADSLTTTLVDAQTLDSSVEKSGQQIGWSRRLIDPAGDSMVVLQRYPREDGSWYTNRAVYHRASDGN